MTLTTHGCDGGGWVESSPGCIGSGRHPRLVAPVPRQGLSRASSGFAPGPAVAPNRGSHGLKGRDGHLLHSHLVLGPRAVLEGVRHSTSGSADLALKRKINAKVKALTLSLSR